MRLRAPLDRRFLASGKRNRRRVYVCCAVCANLRLSRTSRRRRPFVGDSLVRHRLRAVQARRNNRTSRARQTRPTLPRRGFFTLSFARESESSAADRVSMPIYNFPDPPRGGIPSIIRVSLVSHGGTSIIRRRSSRELSFHLARSAIRTIPRTRGSFGSYRTPLHRCCTGKRVPLPPRVV